ncbi:cupin domain-containing protein [Streptomyces sp. NPDC057137]|uniref:AraC family transcriptional regulator n=1 Tax=Streptomyces sp. NPDC057137 TaxID=3346030 RepID=UPI003625D494
MAADPLSDTLALIDARCVISGGFSVGGPWALRFRPQARLKLAAVMEGSCWLTVDGVQGPVLLEKGDVAVLNDRLSVTLASDPALDPTESAALFAERSEAVISIGEKQGVVVIGGHVELNRSGEDLLLMALPPVIHIRAKSTGAPAIRWLLDQLLKEMTTKSPGVDFAAHLHAQLLLVEVLRAHLAESQSFPAGWLRVLADAQLSPALRLMHEEPGRSWGLGELARSASMSRTTFASHFKSAAGVPPLTYLYQWRMRLAEHALREDDIPISKLALTLGYASESAFSNAFKRTRGIAPTRYRNAARATASR